jgi:hypothetical protein
LTGSLRQKIRSAARCDHLPWAQFGSQLSTYNVPVATAVEAFQVLQLSPVNEPLPSQNTSNVRGRTCGWFAQSYTATDDACVSFAAFVTFAAFAASWLVAARAASGAPAASRAVADRAIVAKRVNLMAFPL